MAENLLEKLKQYAASDFYPLHMPGHKRRIGFFGDPFAIDITEIDGFDDLHHARGILLEAQRRAARLYGAEETCYLVNGSTCGILAAVAASVTRGGRILMARNSHRSCYHAAFLNDLRVTYVCPPVVGTLGSGRRSAPGEDALAADAHDASGKKVPLPGAHSALGASGGRVRGSGTGCGICGSIRPEDVREALRRHPDIQAVLVTSPTYDGVVSDIGAIAEAAHAAGAVLIVDEAHGAHFGMHPYFPERALKCGADIVINSLHKTLPSLTQTALLHVQGDRADREKLRNYLDIYQTSSPSYVLMAGMDACVRLLEERGGELFDAFAGRLERMRGELRRKLQILRLLDKDASIYDFDRSKVVISTAAVSGERISAARFGQSGRSGSCAASRGAGGSAMSGSELAAILREKYHLEPEMAAADYVTAIMTVADTQEGFDRLTAALLEIDRELTEGAEAALACAGNHTEEGMGRKTDSDEAEHGASGDESTGMGEQKSEPERTDMAGGAAAARWTEYPVNEQVLTIRQAQESPSEPVPLPDSAGRVSAEYVYLYPPGIPLLVPGERISAELLLRLRMEWEAGLALRGMADDGGNVIRAVKEIDQAMKYR